MRCCGNWCACLPGAADPCQPSPRRARRPGRNQRCRHNFTGRGGRHLNGRLFGRHGWLDHIGRAIGRHFRWRLGSWWRGRRSFLPRGLTLRHVQAHARPTLRSETSSSRSNQPPNQHCRRAHQSRSFGEVGVQTGPITSARRPMLRGPRGLGMAGGEKVSIRGSLVDKQVVGGWMKAMPGAIANIHLASGVPAEPGWRHRCGGHALRL